MRRSIIMLVLLAMAMTLTACGGKMPIEEPVDVIAPRVSAKMQIKKASDPTPKDIFTDEQLVQCLDGCQEPIQVTVPKNTDELSVTGPLFQMGFNKVNEKADKKGVVYYFQRAGLNIREKVQTELDKENAVSLQKAQPSGYGPLVGGPLGGATTGAVTGYATRNSSSSVQLIATTTASVIGTAAGSFIGHAIESALTPAPIIKIARWVFTQQQSMPTQPGQQPMPQQPVQQQPYQAQQQF